MTPAPCLQDGGSGTGNNEAQARCVLVSWGRWSGSLHSSRHATVGTRSSRSGSEIVWSDSLVPDEDARECNVFAGLHGAGLCLNGCNCYTSKSILTWKKVFQQMLLMPDLLTLLPSYLFLYLCFPVFFQQS